jgi:hypothetical protein
MRTYLAMPEATSTFILIRGMQARVSVRQLREMNRSLEFNQWIVHGCGCHEFIATFLLGNGEG